MLYDTVREEVGVGDPAPGEGEGVIDVTTAATGLVESRLRADSMAETLA